MSTDDEYRARALSEIGESIQNIKSRPEIAERLKAMIQYALGRQDYYEDLRNRYLTIGLALFAGSLAFAGLFLKSGSPLPVGAALSFIFCACVLAVTGVVIVFHYNIRSADEYGYRLIADIRSWYYRYTVPEGLEVRLLKGKKKRQEQAESTIAALKHYATAWAEYAATDSFAAEDIEQVFILFILQKAKRDAARSMRRILTYGLAIAAGFFLLAIILLAYYYIRTPWMIG